MLDTNDIQILKQMFADQKEETRDEIRSCIAGSEARMMREMAKISDEIREEMRVMKEDIVETIGEGILPQIDDHETRLVRLERKTA